MCGFAGFALHAPWASGDEERLRRMTATLVHRGPDDEGLELRPPFGLGFRRLSIIDLEGGHQPIANETGDVLVVANGEIYNFRELRAGLEERGHRFRSGSDVETIAHLYEERGEACVEALDGMFALCLLDLRDPRRPRLLLARDRIGIKPLFWALTPEGLFFGSEPKALLASGALPRALRPRSLLDYLVQGYVSGPEAAWQGMSRLLPAHSLSFEPGRAPRLRRYWDLPLVEEREAASDEELLEALDRAVRSHLVADVPLGAFLSGGIDSNAVVASMARQQEEPVLACTVGFRERSHDELELARASAARLGVRHESAVLLPEPRLALDVLPWHFDEPLADPSTVPTYTVSRMAREHVTVALSGDGGDEVFAGYRRYVFDVLENRLRGLLGGPGRALCRRLGAAYPKLDRAPRALRGKSLLTNLGTDPARAYYASLTQASREEAMSLFAPELRAHLAGHDPFDAFHEHYRRPQIDDPLYRAQYADFHSFLPDQILVKTDRASMAVSLEVRVPLLDHHFVERFVHLPTREKVRHGRGKHAWRRALEGRLSREVLRGPKRGFDTPLRSWLRGELAPAVREAVESLPTDWFDRRALRGLFQEHLSGHRDRSALLWSLLVLEAWRRRHAVGELAPPSGG